MSKAAVGVALEPLNALSCYKDPAARALTLNEVRADWTALTWNWCTSWMTHAWHRAMLVLARQLLSRHESCCNLWL
jgi:hypothetical protein